VLVAITGTPGTGKSSACEVLSRKGFQIIDLNELAEEKGLVRHLKKRDSPGIVDINRLKRIKLPGDDTVFIYSHFAHYINSDMVIVLRCDPRTLETRLKARGWKKTKIRENIEAEAIDLITVEAMENCDRVYEIDTTSYNADKTAHQILDIVKGKVTGHEPGKINWSEDILSWY